MAAICAVLGVEVACLESVLRGSYCESISNEIRVGILQRSRSSVLGHARSSRTRGVAAAGDYGAGSFHQACSPFVSSDGLLSEWNSASRKKASQRRSSPIYSTENYEVVVEGGADSGASPGSDAGNVVSKIDSVELVEQFSSALKGDSTLAAEVATSLVTSLDARSRAALVVALFAKTDPQTAEDYFKLADVNSDGVLDPSEFSAFVEAQAVKYGHSAKPLTSKQIWRVGTRAAIGAFGFGFTDNAVMIVAGDAIQNSIGGTLGLPTLMSAGMGNAVADLFGTYFKEYIENAMSKFMPDLRISSLQMEFKEYYVAETTGACIGVTCGCLLGLTPLLLIKTEAPPVEGTAFVAHWTSRNGRRSRHASALEEAAMHQTENPVSSRTGQTCFASTSIAPVVLPPVKSDLRSSGIALIATLSVGMAIKRVLQIVRRNKK